jgi:hypothetical protein
MELFEMGSIALVILVIGGRVGVALLNIHLNPEHQKALTGVVIVAVILTAAVHIAPRLPSALDGWSSFVKKINETFPKKKVSNRKSVPPLTKEQPAARKQAKSKAKKKTSKPYVRKKPTVKRNWQLDDDRFYPKLRKPKKLEPNMDWYKPEGLEGFVQSCAVVLLCDTGSAFHLYMRWGSSSCADLERDALQYRPGYEFFMQSTEYIAVVGCNSSQVGRMLFGYEGLSEDIAISRAFEGARSSGFLDSECQIRSTLHPDYGILQD